jgi:hypothetical protein
MQKHLLPTRSAAARYLDLFVVGGGPVLAIRFLRRTGCQVWAARDFTSPTCLGRTVDGGGTVGRLSCLGNRTRLSAALIGGIGFGTFIDEIGKFITRDNDYFFQPSISLIYITFVLIYLAFRDLQLRRKISSEEYLVNAINDFEEAIINDLQPEERDRALRYLGAITEKRPDTELAALIEQASVQPRPGFTQRRIRRRRLRRLSWRGRIDSAGSSRSVLQLAINAGGSRGSSARSVDRNRRERSGPASGNHGFSSRVVLAATHCDADSFDVRRDRRDHASPFEDDGAALLSPGSAALDLLHGGFLVLSEPGGRAACSRVQSFFACVRECRHCAGDAGSYGYNS